jgi:hypothetical protein
MIIRFPPPKTAKEKSRELDEFLEVRHGAAWMVHAPVNLITSHGVVASTDHAFLTAALSALQAPHEVGSSRRRVGTRHPAA